MDPSLVKTFPEIEDPSAIFQKISELTQKPIANRVKIES